MKTVKSDTRGTIQLLEEYYGDSCLLARRRDSLH